MASRGERQGPQEYIRSRVKVENRGFKSPCWVWQRSLTEKGYARAFVPIFGRSRVHRVSYELSHGPIPDGLVIDHLCRVTSCCNPEHLEAVTPEENACRRNGSELGKCVRGHDLADTRDKNGNCRPCSTIRNREWRRNREIA